MQASLALETRALALDVHTLLSELDVARWRAELEHAARSKVASIQARLQAVRRAAHSARSCSASPAPWGT